MLFTAIGASDESSLGTITTNAFVAADSVIIPVQASYMPVKGLEQLVKHITRIRKHINYDLEIEGILLTMVDSRSNFSKEIIDETTPGSPVPMDMSEDVADTIDEE